MQIHIDDDLSLDLIYESGQCFRWRPEGSGYHIVAFGKAVTVCFNREDHTLFLDCDEADFGQIWKHYFDLERDYRDIRGIIDKDDSYLTKAAEIQKGLRILSQDPWEMIITFIISQRKNIPAIRKAVETLSKEAGRPINREDYAFPSPYELSKLSEEDLRRLGLGYRAPYIKAVAGDFASGRYSVETLSKLDDWDLEQTLMSLKGVGIKVASCAMLFGFHRLNAFPVDVWMDRVLTEHYPEGFPASLYEPYNGVMQQYLFAYRKDDGTKKGTLTFNMKVNGFDVEASYSQQAVQTIFRPLLRVLKELYRLKGRRIIVFIAAPPAAGKSTLSEALCFIARSEKDMPKIQAIGMDGFHFPNDYLGANTAVIEGQKTCLKDIKGAPETYDVEALRGALKKMKTQNILFPVYDRTIHDVRKDAVSITGDIILLEGNYLLYKDGPWKNLYRFADFRVFINAKEEDLVQRLTGRKILGGLSKEEAEEFVARSDVRNIRLVLTRHVKADLELTMTGNGDYVREKKSDSSEV